MPSNIGTLPPITRDCIAALPIYSIQAARFLYTLYSKILTGRPRYDEVEMRSRSVRCVGWLRLPAMPIPQLQAKIALLGGDFRPYRLLPPCAQFLWRKR